MAVRTPRRPIGQPGPNLRLVGPSAGMTQRALADETAMELAVRMDEARAHVRRMRLALQLRLWGPVDAELARYARKVEGPGRAA